MKLTLVLKYIVHAYIKMESLYFEWVKVRDRHYKVANKKVINCVKD